MYRIVRRQKGGNQHSQVMNTYKENEISRMLKSLSDLRNSNPGFDFWLELQVGSSWVSVNESDLKE